MRINNIHVWLLIVFTNICLNINAQDSDSVVAAKHKIIMQLSTNDTLAWKGLVNNLKNLKQGWGDSVIIYVVAHGHGIEFLMLEKSTQIEKIKFFSKNGVVFMACENTMKEKNILKASIITEAVFVKMGLAEIVLRQEQGWSYLKAGF